MVKMGRGGCPIPPLFPWLVSCRAQSGESQLHTVNGINPFSGDLILPIASECRNVFSTYRCRHPFVLRYMGRTQARNGELNHPDPFSASRSAIASHRDGCSVSFRQRQTRPSLRRTLRKGFSARSLSSASIFSPDVLLIPFYFPRDRL